MKIGVLLGVLCIVVGTVGLTVGREETGVGSSNTSEPIKKNDNVTTSNPIEKNVNVTTMNIVDVLISKNNSDAIGDKFSLLNRSFNESNSSTIIPVNDLNVSEAEEKPKNIILVMVEGNESENSWKKLKENQSFVVEGLIQSCKMQEKSSDINTTDAAHDKNCDCNKLLKQNIIALIEYARLIKGMNTATVSEGNTLPTVLDFDNLPHQPRLIGNIDNVVPTPTTLEFPRQLSNESRSLNNEKHSVPTHYSTSTDTKSSIAPTPHIPIKHHKNNKDYVWDFFNIITKIRLDFFKNLFDSLHKSPIFNSNQNMYLRKPSLVFPIQQSPTLIELISNTFMDFQKTSNDKGSLMIIVAPHNELSAIYQVIQSQSSTKVDLVIMLGLEHTHDKKTVPYVANGPGANYLNNLQTIYELPLKVQLILDHCQGICENKKLSNSRLSSSESFIPKKRVVRSEDDDTAADDDKSNDKESSESESGNEDADGGGGGGGSDDESIDKKSSAGVSFHFKKDYITIFLSIIFSIITAFISHT